MKKTAFPRIVHKYDIDGSDYKRCSVRRDFLQKYISPGSTGVELGVFTGAFIDWLLSLNLSKLFIVDPWYRQGATWDWAVGNPSTLEALRNILRLFREEIDSGILIPIVDYSDNFLKCTQRSSLDWVYIDTTHQYEQTKLEIVLSCAAVRDDGIILGDDYYLDPKSRHAGVRRAVAELESAGVISILDIHDNQFAVKPSDEWESLCKTLYPLVCRS